MYSEPGICGADMNRYFTVRMRAPCKSPAFCLSLNSAISSGSNDMLVVVVTP